MSLTDRTGQPLGGTGAKFSKSFLARADEACFWESYVGAALAREGLYVLHEPMHLGERNDPAKSLTCDLHVGLTESMDPSLDLEVKSRRTRFNSPDDFDRPVTVCSQSWFLKNWPGHDSLGRDFLLVSSTTTAIVWVPALTPVTLGVEVLDRDRNELYKTVTVEPGWVMGLTEFLDHCRYRLK